MRTIASLSVSNAVAVVAGPRLSFLDHIMPLVDHWQIPLVCTDGWVFNAAKHFYPPAEIILANEDNFQKILSGFKTFISVEPCRLHQNALQFGQFLYQGPNETIAGFHGNPKKFRNEYWIERYVHEDYILVYGQYLIDYLKEKGLLKRHNAQVVIGNLRRSYYLKNQSFFDTIALPHHFSNKKRKTVFWAPTWSYPDWSNYSSLLKKIPDHFQLMLKLHPFMHRLYPENVEQLQNKWAESEQIRILDEIPLIYPFIEYSDYYIGDDSSVAFDFLSMNRPIFLYADREEPWATTVDPKSDLFFKLDQRDPLSEKRKEAYTYVYGHLT